MSDSTNVKKIQARCLGVIVIYDSERAPIALENFRSFLEVNFSDHCIRVVSNSAALTGDIVGSNRCGEFSGWSEGMRDTDYDKYSIIIFANDTFSTRRPFDSFDREKFIQKLSIAVSSGNLFLIGELCWHINYRLMLARRMFVLKWVRTNIFAISADALKKIGGVSLTEQQIFTFVNSDINGNFFLSSCIPNVYRHRVEDWLNPSLPHTGWHGSKNATKEIKCLKAMCVLQELFLSKRCVESGVNIYSTSNARRRDYLLELLYWLQRYLFRS